MSDLTNSETTDPSLILDSIVLEKIPPPDMPAVKPEDGSIAANDSIAASGSIKISEEVESTIQKIFNDTKNNLSLTKKKKDKEIIYASMDGCMIRVEGGGFSEVKGGHVWAAKDIKRNGSCNGEPRYAINRSSYSANLGYYKDFIPKFEVSLQPYIKNDSQLVFITDGAAWIHEYLTTKHQNSILILYYYHALEYLTTFQKVALLSDAWLEEQTTRIRNNEVQDVVKTIKAMKLTTGLQREQQDRICNYYTNNTSRMQYKTYMDAGLQIGSGAMEAANRTVVQNRCKKSGQVWSQPGANNVLNLVVARMSGKWNFVTDRLTPSQIHNT